MKIIEKKKRITALSLKKKKKNTKKHTGKRSEQATFLGTEKRKKK